MAVREAALTGSRKIVQVLTELRPAGAERIVSNLSRELVRRGHELAVVSLRPLPTERREIVEELERAGIPVRSIELGKLAPWRLAALGPALRELAPDLVHCHLFHANMAGRLARRRRDPWKLINTVHICERRPGKGWQFELDRRTLHRCDRQSVVSRAIQRFHADKLGVAPETLPVVLNGIDPPAPLSPAERAALRERWGIREGESVLGSVGRLDWQKGYDILLRRLAEPEVLATLGLSETRRAALVLIGDGPERATLNALGRDVESASEGRLRVVFAGFVPDAARACGAMDLFLMPSRYEGFGLTLIEAMGHGLPILASPVDSLPELLEDYPAGRAVDFAGEDPGELGEALRAGLEQGPGEPVRLWTTARMTDETLALYEDVLA